MSSTPIPVPGPAVHAFAVTPSDDTVFPTPTRFIWTGAVSGTASIAVLLAGDDEPVTLTNVQAGTLLPISVQKVLATGTAGVSNLVGLY